MPTDVRARIPASRVLLVASAGAFLAFLDATIDVGLLGLGRTFGLFGRLANIAVAQPYLSAHFTGTLDGEPAEASRSGFGDTKVRLAWHFIGNPAMPAQEFAKSAPATTIGASLTVSAPTGVYHP